MVTSNVLLPYKLPCAPGPPLTPHPALSPPTPNPRHPRTEILFYIGNRK